MQKDPTFSSFHVLIGISVQSTVLLYNVATILLSIWGNTQCFTEFFKTF